MEDLPVLPRYSGETTDELIALKGSYRLDTIVMALDEAIQEKSGYVGKDGLTEEERIVLAVESLEREVNNGGYDQYFVNTPEYAPMIVAALTRVGRPDVAQLTQRAIDALGISGPVTVEKIEEAIHEDESERVEKLDACDREYYDKLISLEQALFAFVEANRDKIDLSYERTPRGW
jgi:hypothetical protein